jgi:hypothetical protein
MLVLLGPIATHADTTYTLQPIVRQGETVGGVKIGSGTAFQVHGLNDRGHLLFVGQFGTGGIEAALIQFADGKFTPIVVPRQDAPGGKWNPVSFDGIGTAMNAQGDVLLTTAVRSGGKDSEGAYLWSHATQSVTPVATPGIATAEGLTLGPVYRFHQAFNDRGDVAFAASVKGPSGSVGGGVFFRGQDGRLLSVALPGQERAGLGQAAHAFAPGIDSDGRVVFLATPKSNGSTEGAALYLWPGPSESGRGEITLLVTPQSELPGGGKVAAIGGRGPGHNEWGVGLSNSGRDALVAINVDRRTAPLGLFRLSEGRLLPVAIPGQEMPGGGTLRNLLAVSTLNGQGQYAFTGRLQDGASAAYLLDASGKIALVLKSGAVTNLGTVTGVGVTETSQTSWGIGLNNKGEIAVPLQIAGQKAVIALLTPSNP